MIKYVNGDLFDNMPDGPVVIAHICNDKGAWGSGFVVPLGNNFPQSRQDYIAWAFPQSSQAAQGSDFGRGRVQFVEVQPGDTPEMPNVTVANMVAQTLGGERPIYYNDLARCMDKVAHFMLGRLQKQGQIICPMFGSGLAGGDWNFVEKLIEDCWVRRGIDVKVCYLPQFLPDWWSPPADTPQ